MERRITLRPTSSMNSGPKWSQWAMRPTVSISTTAWGRRTPKISIRLAAEHGCDVAVSLDGDADRLIMADGEGHVYNGDELLYVIVRDRMLAGPVSGVVGT